ALKEFVEKKRAIVSSLVDESGPEHQRRYTFTWLLKESPRDQIWTRVTGETATTKKAAEESASKEALKVLQIWYR
ncbi:hypothetical protein FRC17_007883, partial [Serendipita sp. 399]